MDEEDSCAFLMRAGNKNEKFFNTLIVNLPLSLNLYDKETAKEISSLFEKLVQAYMPYWGCISNNVLSRKYEQFLAGNLPTTIHWINYWSEVIICAIEMKKLQKIIDKYPTISFKKGILSIDGTTLDVDKEDDIRFHDDLQKELLL